MAKLSILVFFDIGKRLLIQAFDHEETSKSIGVELAITIPRSNSSHIIAISPIINILIQQVKISELLIK